MIIKLPACLATLTLRGTSSGNLRRHALWGLILQIPNTLPSFSQVVPSATRYGLFPNFGSYLKQQSHPVRTFSENYTLGCSCLQINTMFYTCFEIQREKGKYLS